MYRTKALRTCSHLELLSKLTHVRRERFMKQEVGRTTNLTYYEGWDLDVDI
jgi:hypothetical protein